MPEKRPRGRPWQGNTDKVAVFMAPELRAHLERRAKDEELTISVFIRRLIKDDMRRHEQPTA